MNPTDRPVASLRSRVVRPAELTVAECAAWSRLCGSVPALRSPFYTPRYAMAVDEAHGGVRVCVILAGDEPVAFLPFEFADWLDSALGSARRVGDDLTDYAGLVAPPGWRIDVDTLLRLAGINYFLITHLDEWQLAYGLPGEKPQTGLRIELPEGGAAYWRGLQVEKRRFVADTERRERKLVAELGPLAFRLRAERPTTALDFLIERKSEQYVRTGRPATLAQAWKRRLLRILAQSDDVLCEGALSTLHAGETWVASHFGLRCLDTLHYWFPVYNPALTPFSPGRLLLKAIIESATEAGVRAIDRGAGEQDAKRDFATHEHVFYRAGWHRSGVRGALPRVRMAIHWRLNSTPSVRSGH